TRLEMAARLAMQHGAHLTGLHVVDIPSVNYFYGAAMPFVPANPEEIVERIRAEARQAAAPGEEAVRGLLHRNGHQGWLLRPTSRGNSIRGRFSRDRRTRPGRLECQPRGGPRCQRRLAAAD